MQVLEDGNFLQDSKVPRVGILLLSVDSCDLRRLEAIVRDVVIEAPVSSLRIRGFLAKERLEIRMYDILEEERT